jgi:CopG-like RHH_1 or ribbon-helix-helix domain, RHH_5
MHATIYRFSPPAPRRPRVSVTLHRGVLELLAQLALTDGRTTSNMAAFIVGDWLSSKGLWDRKLGRPTEVNLFEFLWGLSHGAQPIPGRRAAAGPTEKKPTAGGNNVLEFPRRWHP